MYDNHAAALQAAPGKEKYAKWYMDICDRGRSRVLTEYFERHHVIPRALGGSNDRSNLAVLTYREHFLVHWLLAKFLRSSGAHKMRYALMAMTRKSNTHERIVSGWQFDVARRAAASSRPAAERAKISAALKGMKKSEEHRARLSAVNAGKKMPAEVRAKIGDAMRGRPGKSHTEVAKAKMRRAHAGKKLSDAHRAKLSEVRKGTKRSEATRANISAAQRGRVFSAEHRAKISAAAKNRSEEHKAKLAAARLGSKRGPMSEDHKESIRAGWRKRVDNQRGERNGEG